MAENQYVNKVTYGTNEDGTENVLIDLSKDTVDSAHLAEGYAAHDKTGAIINGAAKIGEGTVNIIKNGTYDVKQYAEANVNVPIGVDTSEDTVTTYDLYSGITAHNAVGKKIIGQYKLNSMLLKTSDTENYTSTQLSMECPYSPSAVSVHYIGSGLVANQVLDLVAWNSKSGMTPYYCGHSLNARNNSYYTILSTQILLTSAPDKFTWDGKKVYIKSPDSKHGFKNGTYRMIVYR